VKGNKYNKQMHEKMRKKNRIPLPLVVDDFSPTSGYLERHNFDSIDLAGSSVASLDLRNLEESRIVPNLEVIEELESIRGMIECKSKDLRVREMSLSKSISKWNSDISESQRLIENLSGNLIEVGEKRLEGAFLKHEANLNRLIEKLNKQIKKYDETARRWNKSSSKADIPPIPSARISDNILQLGEVLQFISSEPYSSSRCTAISATMLMSSKALSPEESDFILNAILASINDLLKARFTNHMIQTCSSELFRLVTGESRFRLQKHSVLRKRLGLGELGTRSIEIILGDNSAGQDRVVDVTSELRNDRLIEIWTNSLNRGAAAPILKSFLRVFADPHVQGSVCCCMKAKIPWTLSKFKVVDCIINQFEESKVTGLLGLLRNEIESAKARKLRNDHIILLVFLFIQRSLEDGLPLRCSNELNETVRALVGAIRSKTSLTTALSTWDQGLWYMMSVVVCFKEESGNQELTSSILDLLEHVDSFTSVIAWRDVILDRLGKNLVHASFIGRMKSLLKRLEE
jgi:hypothetical protein